MTNDVLIIGGGIIGLACGVELKLRGANVTVLCRDFTAAASHAAAGMLAPDAENITNEAMLSLCRRSRNLYLDWTEKLEKLTRFKLQVIGLAVSSHQFINNGAERTQNHPNPQSPSLLLTG